MKLKRNVAIVTQQTDCPDIFSITLLDIPAIHDKAAAFIHRDNACHGNIPKEIIILDETSIHNKRTAKYPYGRNIAGQSGAAKRCSVIHDKFATAKYNK